MGFVEAMAPAVVPAGERACCGSWGAGNGECLKTGLAGGVSAAAFFVGCIEVSDHVVQGLFRNGFSTPKDEGCWEEARVFEGFGGETSGG